MSDLSNLSTPSDPAKHGWTVKSPEDTGIDAAIAAFETAAPNDKARKLIVVDDDSIEQQRPVCLPEHGLTVLRMEHDEDTEFKSWTGPTQPFCAGS